jgi:hypothetical protein
MLAILAAAAASPLIVRAAPGYDPWTWLLWGRELASGTLSTADGPAFKPLPVAVCALLAPLGSAAPVVWVVLVRAAAGAALVLAYRLARDLDQPRRGQTPSRVGRGLLAGGLAVVGVALAGGFALETSRGGEAPLVITGALGAIACWRAGRLRAALALAGACALLRVEAWPFVALAGVAAWRRDPALRAPLAVLAVLVPAAWFVPEWLGSGDVLRSGSRARIPNPGQPALADVPALASLWAAAKLLLVPLWIGVVLALREPRGTAAAAGGGAPAPGGGARLLAAVGGAWVLLVAAMAQAGFSGEPRYALPGVALLAVAGAAGLARALAREETTDRAQPDRSSPRWRLALGATAAAAVLSAAPALAELRDVRDAQAHQWALARDLDAAVRAAGGREEVLACGRPYVGRYRGPLMAYALDVTKRTVEPDAAPHAPGVVFRARLTAASAPAPAAGPPFRAAARAGEWEVLRSCAEN